MIHPWLFGRQFAPYAENDDRDSRCQPWREQRNRRRSSCSYRI